MVELRYCIFDLKYEVFDERTGYWGSFYEKDYEDPDGAYLDALKKFRSCQREMQLEMVANQNAT